jgi:threonine/homoserine/homoserine lactone efflux protein
LNIENTIMLFIVMVLLAAIPSSSVLLVLARASLYGVSAGISAAIGIVIVDIGFVLLATLGIAGLGAQFSQFFIVIKFISACYLLWLGVNLYLQAHKNSIVLPTPKVGTRYLGSMLQGMMLTLGDIKALFFYSSLLPLFLDSSKLERADVLLLAVLTFFSVGGVKVSYALPRSRFMTNSKTMRRSVNSRRYLQ